MEKDKLYLRAEKIAEKVRTEIGAWQEEYGAIGDLRGIGCMLGVEFVRDGKKTPWPELVAETVREAVLRGLIIESAGTYGNVIRFLSPLVISDAQLERGLEILKEAIAVSHKRLS
jgi:4-aminobutyrate aminotransferase/(S)-3-amino-2-methylpropionate transaminase